MLISAEKLLGARGDDHRRGDRSWSAFSPSTPNSLFLIRARSSDSFLTTPPTFTPNTPTILLEDCTTVLSAYVCPPLEEAAVTTIRFARQHCYQSILTMCLFSHVLPLVKMGTAYKSLHINTQLVFQEGFHGPCMLLVPHFSVRQRHLLYWLPVKNKKKKKCVPLSHISLSRAVWHLNPTHNKSPINSGYMNW